MAASRHPRRAVVAALALAAVLLPAHADAKAPSKRAACKTLKGKPVLTTPRLKLVSKRSFDRDSLVLTITFRGCARPSGKVRVLAETASTQATFEYETFFSPVGTRVLRRSTVDDSGSLSEDDTVLDVRTGRTLYAYYPLARNKAFEADTPPPSAAVLTASGELAATFPNDPQRADYIAPAAGSRVPAGETAVIGFTAKGDPRVLDRGSLAAIPDVSLGLRGTVATWTNASTPMSFDLTTLGTLPPSAGG